MGNNPTLNKDWLGDYFTWGNQSVKDRYDRLRNENGNRLEGYINELSALDLNSKDEKMQGKIAELQTLIKMHSALNLQWNEMEESGIEFNVTNESPSKKGAGGQTKYESGRVNIKVGVRDDNELMAHEFRHGYAFIVGEYMSGGMLDDITDEVAAYNVGYLFLERETASLVAKGFYNVYWFKRNMLNSELYKHLEGKEESLSTNTLASIVMKYHSSARISWIISIDKNNANLTIKEAMQKLNSASKRTPPEFQFEDLLKNK